MQYSVPIQGVETRKVEVELAGIFSSPKLMVDGMPVPQGAKRGEYIIHLDDGTEMIAKIKNRFLDPIPNIVVDGEEIILVESLQWYQWLWAGLPILLIFGGGAIGGATGFVATSISARIFRSDVNKIVQYAYVAAVSIGAIITYFVIEIGRAHV